MLIQRRRFQLSLVILAVTAGLLPDGPAVICNPSLHSGAESLGKVRWEPCVLRGPNIKRKCGRYEVFENRQTQSGRVISLNIVVIPAAGADRRPDPVFFFAGGPGQGAAGGAMSLGALGRNRDLVFVDQRGTGHSNPLNCREFDDPADLQAFFGDPYPVDKMRACLEKIEKIANPALYTTSIAVDDIDEVREALGYDQINLFGVSYGTQAAQVYLRQHPEHVRSVLLEGVAPLDTKLPLQFARGAQAALNSLFTDCAVDQDCHRAFRHLRQEFAILLRRLEIGPVTFEVTNPATQVKEQVTVSRGNFVVRLLSLLYSSGAQARVPWLIHRASGKDFEPFALAALRMNPGGGVARGAYFTITCSESIPFITEKEIVKQTKHTFFGDYRTRVHLRACREWPAADVSPQFIEPVKSNKPVLMLSGSIDPATPSWLGATVLKYLPNARQLLVPNAGHSLGTPCVDTIAAEFLEKASVKEIATECVKDIKRPPFVIETN